MVAKERIDCWLVIVDTGGHPNVPRVELEFDSLKQTEKEAEDRRTELTDKFAKEVEESDDEPFQVAHVVKAPCAALTGDLWAVQGTYGGIPGDPTLYPSREAAETAFRKFAAEEGIEVQPNVGEGLFAEGDKQEIRMYGPIHLAGGG